MSSRTRFSRPCYDKPHRCPGWSGGGLKSPARSRCPGGRIAVTLRSRGEHDDAERAERAEHAEGNTHPAANPWRFGRCNRCRVIVLPWATRRLDPTWLMARARWAARQARWAAENARTARRRARRARRANG